MRSRLCAHLLELLVSPDIVPLGSVMWRLHKRINIESVIWSVVILRFRTVLAGWNVVKEYINPIK